MADRTVPFSEVIGSSNGDDTLLGEADNRDMLVEIHDRTAGGEMLVARGRLVVVADDRLIISQPQSIGHDAEFSEGRRVEVFLSVHGRIYTFEANVIEPRLVVPLNSDHEIVGTSITRPDRLKVGQRRNNFRVSLAGFESVKVSAYQVCDEDAISCPLDPVRFKTGEMVNGSEGGFAVTIPAAHVIRLRAGQYFNIEFKLPDVPRPMEFLVEARHCRAIHSGQSILAGFMFIPRPSVPEHQRLLHPYIRFLNNIEREVRRRQRQAA